MDLHPIAKQPASAAVFEQLMAELVSGRLTPGSSLPAERSLTDQLKVNRQAVREALQRLSQAGLIRISQGEPTKALDYRRAGGLDLLPRLLIRGGGTIDIVVVRSIMEMRACIGPDVARLAAQRAPSAVIARASGTIELMERAEGDLTTLGRLDLDFWDALVDGADNIAYRLAYNSLRSTYEPMIDALSAVLADELTDLGDHRSIVAAIGDGDAGGAATAARRLLAMGSIAVTEALSLLVQADPDTEEER